MRLADATLVLASDTEALYSVPFGPSDGRRCDFCGVVGCEGPLACGVEDLIDNAGCKVECETWAGLQGGFSASSWNGEDMAP